MKVQEIDIYQTLEDRNNPSEIEKHGPYKCTRPDAWLGHGYYYWDTHRELAHWWGEKTRKNLYVITTAKYINDNEVVWDLHGNGQHLTEFRELLEELIDKKIVNPDTVLVSQIILFFYKKGVLKYKAIRALGMSERGSIWSKTFYTSIRLSNRETTFLSLYPPVQICFIDKTALLLHSYAIVYPEEYIFNKYA